MEAGSTVRKGSTLVSFTMRIAHTLRSIQSLIVVMFNNVHSTFHRPGDRVLKGDTDHTEQ